MFISKTAVKFHSQTLFASVIADFPRLRGHLKSWEGEVIFVRDYNDVVIFVRIRTSSECFVFHVASNKLATTYVA